MTKQLKRAEGFSLLTVIFFLVAGGVLGASAVALVGSYSSMTVDEYHSQQAFDLAQSGLQYVTKELDGDSDWSDNDTIMFSMGPGNVVVTYLDQTTTTATVRADGVVQGITTSASQTFRASGIVAFDKAIYTEKDIIVDGAATGNIYGPVSAAGDIDDGSGVVFHEDVDSNDPDVSVPTPDWTYWQSLADQTIVGNYSFEAGTYNGIYYITGDVTVKSNVTLKGSIVSRGGVTLNGAANVTIDAVPPNPAIIAEGEISITGSANLNINGFVFSLNSLKLAGNTDVTMVGGVVAKKDVTLSGNSDVDFSYDDSYAPTDGFDGGEISGIVMSDWREVY